MLRFRHKNNRKLLAIFQFMKNKICNVSTQNKSDVVIIGGGVTGCSILYQLSKRGCAAVLCEKAKLTSGTTWHTAGLVWSLRPNATEVQILKRTKQMFKELGEENVGWINNGTLFIAHDKIEEDKFEELRHLGAEFGVDSQIIGEDGARELFPLLSPNSFVSALYSTGI